MTRTKTKKKKHAGLTVLFILALLVFLWWFGTYTLSVTKCTVESDKINGDVTIVQLSDLHGALFGKDNSNLISTVEAQDPDIVVATGDMYSSGRPQDMSIAVSLLGALAEEYPVYFVNGEHDNSDEFFSELRDAGVHVMDYKNEYVTVNGTNLLIYGIDNVYYTPTFDLANEYTLDSSVYSILLAHMENPSAFERFGVDLALCGDTHGGQIRLPYFGAVYYEGVWFPEYTTNGAYIKGLYDLGGTKMFVSSGLGNFPYPIRIFDRPEVAVITLTSGK